MVLTLPSALRCSPSAGRYGAHSVLIAVLLFSEFTIAKLAAHAIGPEEVRQVSDGDRVVIANPRPRVDGSVLMIGATHGGRVLTVVLNPEPTDPGAGTCGRPGRRAQRRSAATAATAERASCAPWSTTTRSPQSN